MTTRGEFVAQSLSRTGRDHWGAAMARRPLGA